MPVPAAGLPNTDAPLAAWPNAEALLLLLFEPNAEPLPSAPNPDGVVLLLSPQTAQRR